MLVMANLERVVEVRRNQMSPGWRGLFRLKAEAKQIFRDSRGSTRLPWLPPSGGSSVTAESAAGADARRVRGDLERFKEFIEGRSDETGAWRGDVSAGERAES